MSQSATVLDHPVVAGAAQASQSLGAACSSEVWRLSDGDVEAGLAAVVDVLSRAEALRGALLREAEARALRERTGAPTTEKWLGDRFVLSRSCAGAWLRDAAGLGRHPAVEAALADAELTGEQAAAVVAVMDRVTSLPAVHPADVAQAGALLLEHAVAMTPPQIATAGQDLVERLSRVPDVDDPAEQAAVERAAEQAEREAQHGERNELRIGRRVGGRLRGRFDLGPLGEAALLAWLRRADRPVPGSDGMADERPRDERRGDALAELFTAAAGGARPEDPGPTADVGPDRDHDRARDDHLPGGGLLPDGLFDDDLTQDGSHDDDLTPHGLHGDLLPDLHDDDDASLGDAATGERAGRLGSLAPVALLHVSVTLAELRAALPGAGRTDPGAGVSAATLRELACDALVVPAVLGSASQVLDIGRASRTWTPAQRRAIALRDRGCAAPGCDRPPSRCHVHHAWHWAAGGPTDLDNGVALCGFHHRMVHRQGWTVRLAGNGYAEFLPPASIDPERRPRQHIRFRLDRLDRPDAPDRADGWDPLGTRHRE